MFTNKKTGRVALGLSAILSLGLLAVELTPAEAQRSSRTKVRRRVVSTSRYRSTQTRPRVTRRATRRNSRYGRFSARGDWDYDGIPNNRDRDIDNDGVPNSRDRHDYNTDRR